MKGIDFSWARPGGAAIKAAGNEFVIRYVPFSADDGGHGLTVAEVADYQANGLAIGQVYESGAARHLDGFAAGAEDAQRCILSRQWTGFPDTLPFYFAVDFDAQPNQMPAIIDYQKGAASVLGKARVGIYGSYAVINYVSGSPNGYTAWFWQTYAWSQGLESPNHHLYQYENGVTLNGGEVDLCKAYGPAQGLWLPPGQEIDDMTDQEREDLKNLVAIMGGSAKIKDNADRGNDFILGYSLEQQKLGEHIADKDAHK